MVRIIPYIEVNGRNIELNDEGFIARPEEWSEDLSRAVGVLEDISRNKRALRVILYPSY